MKHLIASLTIGACLLLPSAGVVFAEALHGSLGPHTGGNAGMLNGQPGTGGGGASCVGGGGAGSPPGQVLSNDRSSSTNSPFIVQQSYAGAGAGNPSAPDSVHANSQYDVACFQHQ
jgi:hypothetical protein